MAFSTYPSEPIPTVTAMPHWFIILVLAIVAWLTLAIGGGLLVGRLIDGVSRLLPPQRRRIA